MTPELDQPAASAANEPRSCAHCGIPLAHREVRQGADAYCCYGCFIAHELVGAQKGEERGALLLLMRLGLTGFLSANVMILTWAAYGDHLAILFPVEQISRQTLHVLALLLSVPVFLLLGVPYLKNARREVSDRRFGVDTLIAAGTTSAFLVSIAATIQGTDQVYFDTATVVLVLVTFGRYLESTARLRASTLLRSFKQAGPAQARRLVGVREELIPVSALQVGDLVRIFPGEQVPVDGEVVEGETSVDEALLTGESAPVPRRPGDRVLGGSVNQDGSITIRASAIFGDTFLARLAMIVEQRLSNRSSTQRVMDVVASWFTPGVILIAVTSGGYLLLTIADPGGALLRFLSVLLIACPCALGIGTSLAESVAFHRALRNGILGKSLDTLEKAGAVEMIVFDKTGTITRGEPSVVGMQLEPGATLDKSDICAAAAALERHVDHPYARAITAYCAEHASTAPAGTVGQVKVLAGRGVAGCVCLAGREPQALRIVRNLPGEDLGIQFTRGEVSPDVSEAFLWYGEVLQGRFLLRDRPRPEAWAALSFLSRQGIECLMVSGDAASVVGAVAQEVGIREWHASQLPAEKTARIDELLKRRRVAMVGDGVNDAPALSASHCGIAFNAGTDLSRQAADIIVLGAGLWKIPWLIEVGRRLVRTIRWNMVWMFSYNVVGIGLAASGLLNPVFAALSMVASSAMVIANSGRLSHSRIQVPTATTAE